MNRKNRDNPPSHRIAYAPGELRIIQRRNEMINPDFWLYHDQYYLIEQCTDCPLPGYLIVKPISGARSLEELTEEEQAALGRVLAKAIRAVKKAVQPVRVYCAQFGEKGGPLHFHIFPRTEEITREYLRERPIDGRHDRRPRPPWLVSPEPQ